MALQSVLAIAAGKFARVFPLQASGGASSAGALVALNAAGLVDTSMVGLSGRNMVIDGNFSVNQRGYASGGTLAAGAYGHDRWKGGANGCAYTFTQSVPDTTITLTSGSQAQVVEGANITAATMSFSWTGSASARVYQGTAASQTSPPYAGGAQTTIGGVAVNTLVVSGLTVGTNTTIEFGPGTVGLVQLEAGSQSTPFERRHPGIELALCQRYYQLNRRLYGSAYAGNTTSVAMLWLAIVPMRVVPTVTLLTASPYAENPPFSAGFTASSATIVNTHIAADGGDLLIGGFSGLTSNSPASFQQGQLSFFADF